ncbi:MAG: NAD(P)/FAD-dependent oxidoreductase [Rhodocyclales bacterium]|jgi:sulfide dehydrogenase [flavocytochrome c] flavoprotein subunit|nr:NAD(P)/FAD-dependent oxidoreductase [Rhodocyclales bacterium]
MTLDRRSFLKLVGAGAGAAGAAGLPMIGMAAELMPKSGRRVVVVGGGYGGTIAAKYVRMLDKSIEVVMIERNKQFVSCPFSNFYIAGLTNDMNSLTIGYDKLAANHGVKMVYAEVTGIDPAAKKVVTDQGTLDYDRLIVSPGIDFRTEEIEGYDAKTAEIFPHAWKAGAQSTLLRNQLQSMKDGGTVIISMPLTPYRCPPGPYERSCLIAHYLKTHKPKSKLILLDANPDVVSKKPLFTKAWSTYYKDNFQYIGGKKITKADTGAKLVSVEGIEDFKGDVINLIPPQRAGDIAVKAGLVGDDKKWCPVDAVSFESTKHKGIHVIGDATALPSDGPPMPKSGYSANSQAKVCAMNVVNLLNGKETIEFSGINVCYSAISDHESVSIAQVFKLEGGKIKSSATAISPADFSLGKAEHAYGESWLKNILTEMST